MLSSEEEEEEEDMAKDEEDEERNGMGRKSMRTIMSIDRAFIFG